jgi:ABC-type multidrug transport system fused ATPase/permease subunit
MEAVGALRVSKTIIIVAHRLSTVDWCNRLYRLENGEIGEHIGTPDTIGAVTRESCS